MSVTRWPLVPHRIIFQPSDLVHSKLSSLINVRKNYHLDLKLRWPHQPQPDVFFVRPANSPHAHQSQIHPFMPIQSQTRTSSNGISPYSAHPPLHLMPADFTMDASLCLWPTLLNHRISVSSPLRAALKSIVRFVSASVASMRRVGCQPGASGRHSWH